MVTGELKSKIDAIWSDFWSGGISNPLEVMEQLTYLLFIKGLDEAQTRAERKANRTGQPIEDPIFPAGEFRPDDAARARPYEDLRWSRFKNLTPADMFELVDKYVFPFMQARAANSTHGKHMRGARLTIPTPGLLAKAVDGIDAVPMDDRDTKGDVYEYMLSKIASAGQNGQFRTPRHIIQLMVAMTAPTPDDTICDPAAGTCGFLVAAGEHIRDQHPSAMTDPATAKHFHERMFHGYDFDNTMLRIGSMNMQLHGVGNPAIDYRDALAEEHAEDVEAYSLVLANPPFVGSLDYESTARDLLRVVKTKKTELLFLALFLRLLKPGGRAAVIVPQSVLFGVTTAHRAVRRILVEEQMLDGVVAMPAGVFKPYAGLATAIVLFTKTNSGGTDHVWFYDLHADGYSLDDKREPLLSADQLGVFAKLSTEAETRNDLPDVLSRWSQRHEAERQRSRTNRSFCVPRAEIASNDYSLALHRYRQVPVEEADVQNPAEILGELSLLQEAALELLKTLREESS
jgi:type I restriction enzyme M protein